MSTFNYKYTQIINLNQYLNSKFLFSDIKTVL